MIAAAPHGNRYVRPFVGQVMGMFSKRRRKSKRHNRTDTDRAEDGGTTIEVLFEAVATGGRAAGRFVAAFVHTLT